MTNVDIRMLWNDRYTKGLPSLEIPDPFFITTYDEYICKEFPGGGRALDLAAGTGRHSLYLARRAWNVMALDISDVAMQQLAEKAEGLRVETVCTDLVDYQLEDSAFDLIVLYYYFDRSFFKGIIKALRPGGWLVCKLAVGKPDRPDALQEGELGKLLKGLELVSYMERPVRERGVVESIWKLK